ncbi:hypothetical protein ACJVDH_15935 [Pedobacter sp. AW1-32]|uniref:hypothetical protein n=1 Tax=Pedobacter sp. AW1-32 TaxID=3383026 RepID=UPI003FEF34FD
MELSTLTNLLSDPKTLIEKIRDARPDEDLPSIQPEDHEVMQKSERPDREVQNVKEVDGVETTQWGDALQYVQAYS